MVLLYRALSSAGVQRHHHWPFYVYTKYPFAVLYNDQFDRFSAPIEKRYDPDDVRRLLESGPIAEHRGEAVLRVDRRRNEAGVTAPAAVPERLKVLRVIARLNVGGPARHVVLLDRGLRGRGFETQLIHGDVGADESSMAGLAATEGVPTRKIASLGPRINLLSDVRAFLELVSTIFREAPDVVHTHTAKAGTLGRLSAALYNLTRPSSRRALVVHTFHGHVFTGYFSAVTSRIIRIAERLLARITDCIVTISPAQRNDIVFRFRIAAADRVVTIPLGLDLRPLLAVGADDFRLREASGIPQHDIVFGYVGRFVPVKDIGTLIRAFAVVHTNRTDSWLILAGDGPGRTQIKALAEACGIADRTRFLSWIDDLPYLYAAIDVCVLSSLNEGTPVALIEALAAARPVVATRVGGVADVVDGGRTGLLVPSGDPQALAESMLRLAADPELRRSMGEAGRRDVDARYSSTRLVEEVDHLYRVGLSRKRGTIAAVACPR